ncbi:hypothetical protein I7I48_11950 [Histoplasma ohiense]|nr:hypothetical protein I7I48_11950 [Histoplasma ohiense (nom. inval.)]
MIVGGFMGLGFGWLGPTHSAVHRSATIPPRFSSVVHSDFLPSPTSSSSSPLALNLVLLPVFSAGIRDPPHV